MPEPNKNVLTSQPILQEVVNRIRDIPSRAPNEVDLQYVKPQEKIIEVRCDSRGVVSNPLFRREVSPIRLEEGEVQLMRSPINLEGTRLHVTGEGGIDFYAGIQIGEILIVNDGKNAGKLIVADFSGNEREVELSGPEDQDAARRLYLLSFTNGAGLSAEYLNEREKMRDEAMALSPTVMRVVEQMSSGAALDSLT